MACAAVELVTQTLLHAPDYTYKVLEPIHCCHPSYAFPSSAYLFLTGKHNEGVVKQYGSDYLRDLDNEVFLNEQSGLLRLYN